MKKLFILPVLLIMMLAFAAPVFADDYVYARKDNVKVYEERNTSSKVLKKMKAGEKLKLDRMNSKQNWGGVVIPDPNGGGAMIGWVPMSDVSLNVMPSSVCKHKWSEWEILEQPTCTKPGSKTRYCPICGIGELHEIEKLGHSFGEWKTVRKATCTQEGERVRVCSRCGKEDHQTIEKAAHSYGDWTVTKQATCTATGERYRKCKVCGHEERQTIEKLPHNYGDWKITKEATCSAEGERVHTCKVCGYESHEVIEKLPHNFEWQIIVEATDHSAGIRTNVCKDCGFKEEQVSYDPEGTLRRGDRGEEVREVQQLLADQNYLNDSGADGIFGSGTEKAVMTFQYDHGLTPDGVAWPQTIRRLQHDFGDWEIIRDVTRDTPGERMRKCKDCGFEQHETIALSPAFDYGARSESVRAVQQMLTSLGHDAGAYDGIYGKKLDAAFDSFAKANGMTFEAGKVLPSEIDALVNSWIASLPKEDWQGEGTLDSPVSLALTVTPVLTGHEKEDAITTYTWSLTNLGNEPCIFTSLLLNYGSDSDFMDDNLVMVIDGQELLPNCGNSVSGSFEVSREWGRGDLNFAALAVSENTGLKWLSNVNEFEGAAYEAPVESAPENVESMAEDISAFEVESMIDIVESAAENAA